MNKVLTAAGITVMALSLGTGAVSAMGGTSGDIRETGRDSRNVIERSDRSNRDVDVDNDVNLRNDTDQDADSGDVVVDSNTTVDGALSGGADNLNDTYVEAHLDNRSAVEVGGEDGNHDGETDGEIRLTGRDSVNRVSTETSSRVDIDVDNNVDLRNDTDQDAESGDVIVDSNTSVGDVSSGNAVNTNFSEFVVSIKN